MSLLHVVGCAGLVAFVVGCGGSHFVCAGGDGLSCDQGDAAPPPPPPDAGDPDACPFCSDAAYDAPPDVEQTTTKFFLLASESTTSPSSNPADWYGVLRFDLDADFAQAVPATGGGQDIDKSLLQDPFGLAFAKTTAEVFVGNRAGNTPGGGSIARFLYDKKTMTFSPTGTPLTGNGVADVHQVALNPDEDQLFVATNTAGLPKFKLVNNTWQANGMFCNPGDWTRGVAVAPDGKRLYVSTAGTVIRQFDLTTNTEILPALQIPNSANLHFMTVCSDPKICSPAQLYVGDAGNPADSGTGGIFRFDIGANDDLTVVDKTAAGPTFSVALSPDGQELFAGSAYANNMIKRFKLTNGAWVEENQAITTAADIMSILVFPANATPTAPPN
jgi:DNA-binding beta-propeller fold protein YncE